MAQKQISTMLALFRNRAQLTTEDLVQRDSETTEGQNKKE